MVDRMDAKRGGAERAPERNQLPVTGAGGWSVVAAGDFATALIEAAATAA